MNESHAWTKSLETLSRKNEGKGECFKDVGPHSLILLKDLGPLSLIRTNESHAWTNWERLSRKNEGDGVCCKDSDPLSLILL